MNYRKISRRSGFAFACLTVVLALTGNAKAGFTTGVKVSNITMYAGGEVDVFFTGSAFTGCAATNAIALHTAYLTQTQINELRAFFTAAKLSNSNVEVNTSGCQLSTGGAMLGKLTYAML